MHLSGEVVSGFKSVEPPRPSLEPQPGLFAGTLAELSRNQSEFGPNETGKHRLQEDSILSAWLLEFILLYHFSPLTRVVRHRGVKEAVPIGPGLSLGQRHKMVPMEHGPVDTEDLSPSPSWY